MRFFTFILRNVFRRRARSMLTMTGIAVAVAAVVALVGISNGFHQSMLELYQGHRVDLIVARSDMVNLLGGTLPEALGREIKALDGVNAVAPGLVDVQALEAEDGTVIHNNVLMQGWPTDSFMFGELEIVEGETLSESSRGKHRLILGKDLAKVTNYKVGDTIYMVGERFTVAGIFRTFAGMENNMVLTLLDDAQRLKGKSAAITGCTVRLKDSTPEHIEEVKAQIEGEVAQKLSLKGKLRASEPASVLKNNTFLNLAKAMAWMTSAVALFIGTIGMLNTMVMSVFERTREIGILRAIGWRPWRVMQMILMESVLLSLAGGIAGTAGALGLIWGLSRLPQVNGAIRATASPMIVLTGFAIALLVGLIGAAYPAYRGARLLPTEALRHE
jgi:putative ABC transport system permease protein